jgi:hypothetical protein
MIKLKTLLLILTAFIIFSCGKEKETKKDVIVIPPNALFVINSEPVPAAYKIDTTQAWVVMDSTAALKALLKMVEDNFKRAVAQQKAQEALKPK